MKREKMLKIDIKKKIKTSTNNGLTQLNANLTIEENKIVCLFGESGSGKTTLLRMIAGLLNPDSGKISDSEKEWYNSDKKVALSPQKRNIGFLFQDFALFPNLTVRENIAYACKDNMKVKNLLELTKLTALADRPPDKLSGGQKQRVALARAIARESKILLLDEPLSSLDNGIKEDLINELLKLQKLFKLTIIFVTHNISEVWKLSDEIYYLKDGLLTKKNNDFEICFNKNLTTNKYSFIGEIINIKKVDVINIILILVGKNIIEIVATDDEAKKLNKGDSVLIASKAFNPIIKKIEN